VHRHSRATWGNVVGLAVVTSTLTPADVRSWCRAQLDVLHQPRRIVVLPALPLTQRGKTDHHVLAEHFNDSTTE
jgi:acyl-CoA synthetase (AMP-forming)/AMP-acid ligase II